ncbi:MAG: hypothetical protein J6O53_08860 [Eubacterium sp.]|nr:hypothetical protein [Eubacterium sp.]
MTKIIPIKELILKEVGAREMPKDIEEGVHDIKELTAISIKAFDSDIQVGGKEAGGPPDYDSESWHRKMMEQNHL